MTLRVHPAIKAFVSLSILALFVWGVGKSAFFPSLRLLHDTQWDVSLFFSRVGPKLIAFAWIVPVGLGLLGWARWFQRLFFTKVEKGTARLLGFSLALSFFSLYVFSLAVNEILLWPLTALFFLPGLLEGWKEWKELHLSPKKWVKSPWALLLSVPALLWLFEYLSPPLVWDAVLDHFRYAREVSRLHQIPFHWMNHTGDMPKFAELILAGFWNLGGESLSKLSSALPALLTSWFFLLFAREWKGKASIAGWIFWTCPFFLALYSWGYVEGFLAFFEVAAVFCFWKAIQEPKNKAWLPATVFFLGTAFVIKTTAVLAIGAVGLIFVYEKFIRKNPLRLNLVCLLAFVLPLFPWLFKNWLAFGNPFYPLATSVFGAAAGYSPEMEKNLLSDTGSSLGLGLGARLEILWRSFFTLSNAVNAAWTPLVAMSLPWMWSVLRKRIGFFLFTFCGLFLVSWITVNSSFRHASGGAVILVLLAALAWEEAFKEKGRLARVLFGVGVFLSLWLCLSAQLTTTAPYASALGLEDPSLRLKRHYSYSTDTYAAYRFIEEHSRPRDRVMAFAVFQTYPLNRMAFVDFKWKRPIFLQWASQCRTAEQLAGLLHKEGVHYFLYQGWEAARMSRVEKDFDLVGMPLAEYARFWRSYMDPVASYENSFVYEVRERPLVFPRKPGPLPGLQEKNGGHE